MKSSIRWWSAALALAAGCKPAQKPPADTCVAFAGTDARAGFNGATISVLAGNGFDGLVNGPSRGLIGAASFYAIKALAVGARGDVFISEAGSLQLRKQDAATGMVSTLAAFAETGPIARDSQDNVFMVLTNHHEVLKIDPAGHVTFFAGDANLFQPGTMDAAVFSAPTGIAVDSHDNVYVADSGHLRIWKVDPSGAVTSFAGDGTYGALYGSASTGPYGGLTLTTDVHDNLYVADWGSMTVRKLSPSGQLSAVPGDDVDETSPRTLLYGAVGLAADAAGTVYVLIGGCTSPWVRQLDPHGNATQLQDLTQPAAIATDLQGRLLRATTTQIERLEADRTNIVMAGIDESGSLNAATRHDGSAEFATPLGLTAIKDHRVVVADADNHVLRAVDACGEVSTFAGDGTDGFLDGPAAKARFSNPTSVARDDAHGLLFVADPGNHRIRAITDDGQVVTFAGNGGSSSKDGTGGPNGTAEFDLIVAIALSPQGLFVSELSEGKNLTKLRLVDLAGTVTTRANTYGGNELALAPDGSLYVTYDDGSLWHLPADPSKAAVHLRLHLASDPYDEPLAYLVTVDHQGYVFISDGASVSAVDERGNLTPLALVVDPNNLLTNPDADPASASGLAVDDEGHIFVSDARRHCIRVITP